MTTNIYEETYSCVCYSKEVSRYVTEVAEFLQKQDKPLSCKEIGELLYGDRYVKNNRVKNSTQINASKLGQTLRHLVLGRLVTFKTIPGEPVTISHWDWVPVSDTPKEIKVHDDEGNTYFIPNPNFDWDTARYERKLVKETITPKVRVYKWAEA